MNLYGFANGDPVNFSDPFGLCPGPLVVVCVWALNALPTVTIIGAEIGTGLAVGNAARFIPNPGGKLGSAAHRAVIQETADALEAGGAQIVAGGGRLAERAIKVGNGRVRFPDIEAVQADGSRVFVNVGRTTKAGNPVARENASNKRFEGHRC